MAVRGWEFDSTRCVGCHACAVACKMENNTFLPEPGESGPGVNYRAVSVRETGAYPNPSKHFMSMACFHCADPACLAACPEGAITKDATDGVVRINESACVGCRYCEWACPYGAPQLNPKTSKMEKCHFCSHRIAGGIEPACVQTCVGRALKHVPDVVPGGDAPVGFASVTLTNPSIKFV